MATGQHKNWTGGRSVIGWSAAGFVAINIVAVNSLTGSRPSGHTHTHTRTHIRTTGNGLIAHPRDLPTA